MNHLAVDSISAWLALTATAEPVHIHMHAGHGYRGGYRICHQGATGLCGTFFYPHRPPQVGFRMPWRSSHMLILFRFILS